MGRPKGSHPVRCLWTRDDGTTCSKFKKSGGDFCVEHSDQGLSPQQRARQVRETLALARYHQQNAAEAAAEERPMAENERPPVQSAEGDALAAALRDRGMTSELDREEAVREQIRTQAEALRGGRSLELDDPDRKRGTVVPPTGAFTMEGAATRAAMELLALEQAEQRRRQELRRRSKGRKKLPPATAHILVPREMDLFTPMGKDGQPLHTPGWIPHWVRDKDPEGKESPQRVRNFEAWGGRPVLDRDNNNEPVVDIYGRYMELPAERYGHKVVAKSVNGAFDHDEYMQEQLYEIAESSNQELGRGLISTYVGDEHGDRSF